MNGKSLDAIWEAACRECKARLSDVAYSCFFEDLKLVSIDGNSFTVSTSDEWRKGFIEETYYELLQLAMDRVMGVTLKPIIVYVNDEQEILNADLYCEGLSFENFFTFDNFVVGSSNRFAQAAAYAVAETPGIQTYNPLVIYGNSGVGKTHLLLAIKNHLRKKYPSKKVVYTRGEEFTNELITALQQGKLGLGTIEDFRTKFRSVDVLLVDDIHFIAGKEQTQEEFFNTFNTLYQHNKQIVVTLDRPLREIKTLDDRIRSRLSGGLFADITPPDFETRVGIIRKKTEQNGFSLEENIIFYIAEHIKNNTRQLEGIIKKLQVFVTIQKGIPTIPIVQEFIKEIINDTKPEPVKIEKIISEVARTYNLTENDILSERRTASLVLARQVAMYIARQTTDLSFKQIGESFGKDHTTVLYAVKNIEKFLSDKPYEKELVDDLIKNITQNN